MIAREVKLVREENRAAAVAGGSPDALTGLVARLKPAQAPRGGKPV